MRNIVLILLLVAFATPSFADCYYRIQKGDSMSKVHEVCGPPDFTDTSGSTGGYVIPGTNVVTGGSVKTTWIYRDRSTSYVYFRSGKVSGKKLDPYNR